MADVVVNVTGNALQIRAGGISGVRDQQLFREAIILPSDVSVSATGNVVSASAGGVSGVREQQLFREAVILPQTIVAVSGNALSIQAGGVSGVRDQQLYREAVILPATVVSVTGNSATLSVGSVAVATTTFKPAQPPSLQFHPVLKPLDFPPRPLLQAGRRRSAFTTMLTPSGASQAFSMPLGARNQPIAGKVFQFTMGGSIVLGNTAGTMTITPLYGATTDGVDLGRSNPLQYFARQRPIPWRLTGEIIFQSVDLTPGNSLVICTGVFVTIGDDSTPDGGLALVFGSGVPVQVDASSIKANASGALNFAATFMPSVMNATTPPKITVRYAFLRS